MKPLFTVKTECHSIIHETTDETKDKYCLSCQGKGFKETKVSNKEDFRCNECNGSGVWACDERGNEYRQPYPKCADCKGKGYILPPNSQVKKVSETIPSGFGYDVDLKFSELYLKHNLKEDDEVVIE